jgi:chromosome condensin MukBEF ATPase and DNA-binding subunit MukB
MDKGNGSGYAIGQGIGSEIAFKLGKIAKVQSLGDALCEAESLENKLEELRECLAKTRNERKRRDINANISKLEEASVSLTGRHEEMEECKEQVKSARQKLFKKVFVYPFNPID